MFKLERIKVTVEHILVKKSKHYIQSVPPVGRNINCSNCYLMDRNYSTAAYNTC